jgi:uncharacterized protein YggT (Ycf19 family)
MEDRQTTEVRQTNEQVGNTTVQRESVQQTTKTSGAVIAQRVVYYVGGVIVSLLLVRFILQLFGASEGSQFVDFIYALSAPFVAPFVGIFGQPTFGQAQFESSTLVAIIVYTLVIVGIAKLIALTRPNEEI